MKKWFRKLRDTRFAYRPLVEVQISRSRLVDNVHTFEKGYPDVLFAPVLKSNAYGHGLIEVAQILGAEASVPFLVVDSYYEVLRLRNEGVRKPVLVLGYTLPENIVQSRFENVAFTITSLTQLHELVHVVESPRPFHLKIDTGMRRQGILPSEVEKAIKLLKANPNIVVEGLGSHLADADSADTTFTYRQIASWNEVVGRWKNTFPETKWYHLAATYGHRFTGEIDANVLRLGIGLFGVMPSKNVALKTLPVLEMRTRITNIKALKKGEYVGYNITFKAPHDMTIATLPMGYYEGIDRRLSNKGSVLVRGVACPIVGRVSMNITSIDVSQVPNVAEGDEVVVISNDSNAPNAVLYWAELCDTIPYEILVHIPSSLRRVYV